MPLPLKFVLLKGLQGFGDRLMCLLQAISYSKATRRRLVIDWRDEDWTHDILEPLDHYFKVVGIPTYGLDEFAQYWNAHAHELSVYPSAWSPLILDPGYSEWIYKDVFSLPNKNADLWAISQYKQDDYEADIVVYPGVGMRTFSYTDLKLVHLSRWIELMIRQFSEKLKLVDQSFDIIHLRAGSKSWAGGHVPLQSLNKEIHDKWPDKNSYLDSLWKSYAEQTSNLSALPLFLLGDQESLLKDWQDKFSCGTIIPNSAFNHLRESGIHKLSASDLIDIGTGVCKSQLTYETLRDFVLMLNTRTLVSDGTSAYSRMALKCKLSGVRMVALGSNVGFQLK